MSWFKRVGSGRGSKLGEVHSSSPSPLRSGANRVLTSTPTRHTDILQDTPQTSPIARRQLRMDTDPDTCSEVFQSHWSQAQAVMGKGGNASPSINIKRTAQEDVEAVLRYVDQMMMLLVEEESQDGGQGPILEFLLTEDILEKLLDWSGHHLEQGDQLKLHQLKLYDQLITLARQELVYHKPVIRPLLKLLAGCQDHPNKDIEHYLVLLLHQLCVCVTQNKYILELLFDSHADHGPAKFLVFSLLISYIHREGDIGQQARDALLLIMSLSYVHDDIGQYIAENSDFCPVLATGLSGLYSSLPRKMEYPSDDWYRLASEDVAHSPELIMFLNSLEFCNAVVQVAHSLVREQLLVYIYTGFLVPVLGPALHQNEILYTDDELSFFYDDDEEMDIFKLPISLIESYFATSMEEVIAATAYLDLFVRRITEPALIRTFLKFVLTAKHDDVHILDSLITRISSNSRLCMVTLSLFRTLIELNCEDVMFQLVFKYLIPCSHVMVSQRRAVKTVDMYSRTADKLLSLRPACCVTTVGAAGGPPDSTDEGTTAANTQDGSLNSSSPPSPSTSIPNGQGNSLFPDPTTYSPGEKFKRFLLRRGRPRTDSNASTSSATNTIEARSSSPDTVSLSSATTTLLSQSPGGSTQPAVSTSSSLQETSSYLEYLQCVRREIEQCANACQCWTFPYDGDSPSIDSLATGTLGPLLMSDAAKKPTEQSPKIVQNGLPPGNHPDDAETKKRRSYTESVASDADSAFSGSSAHTDTQNQNSSGDPQVSPTPGGPSGDSPLSDHFDNADFGAFLLSLKRVETPVEYCDTIEDSFNEIDSKLKHIRLSERDGPQSPSSLPTFTDQVSTDHSLARPVPTIPADDSNSTHPPLSSQEEDALSTSKNTTVRSPSPLLTPLKPTGNPNIGPFLSTLLARLEQMIQNTLYVNLLLTGVLMRLACYGQPLLRSFLLNHTLVFQPTVKSLIQVLSSVKQKVDCLALTVHHFDEMLLKARHFLLWREDVYRHSVGDNGGGRRDSNASFPGALGRGGVNAEPHKERNRSFRDMFRRSQPSPSSSRPTAPPRPSLEPRLRLLSDKQGFRYLNQKSPLGGDHDPMADQLEALRTKNAVYCALVLDEFLKELAAISQEHPVCCV